MPIFDDQFARSQDGLLTRRQALAQLTPDELDRKLGREWQVVLPGVYLTARGTPSARQRRRAALLRAGAAALLTDSDALALYGVPGLPDDIFVHVLVPNEVQRSSRDFMSVCRTTRMPKRIIRDGFPVAPAERALADFIRRHPDDRESLAIASRMLHLRLVGLDHLAAEATEGPARGRPKLLRVLDKLSSGIRSVPEADIRDLIARSRVLPEPLWNCLVRLPTGQLVSPDALFEDAGVVHETNGRAHHAGEDVFEDMQRRNDLMVVAGLVVLHNSPRRIWREALVVLSEIEACYQRNAGRGLPSGVEVVRRSAAA